MHSDRFLATLHELFPNASGYDEPAGRSSRGTREPGRPAATRLDLWTHTQPSEPHYELTLLDCGNGNTETAIVKRTDRYKGAGGNKRGRGERTPRTEMRQTDLERSVRRSKRGVRISCKVLAADRILTLTSRRYLYTRPRLWAAFAEFRRLYQVRFKRPLRYVAVPELHPKHCDHYHIHCAIRGYHDANAVRGVWRQALRNTFADAARDHTPGNIDLAYKRSSNPDTVNRIARYISKYLMKQFTEGELHEKRYEKSRGLRAKKIKLYAPLGCLTDLDLIRKVQELSNGVLARNPRWEVYSGFDCLLIETEPPSFKPGTA